MRSMKRWARALLEFANAGDAPQPEVLAAFAQHYLSLADHADRQVEAVALFAELRSQGHVRHDNPEAALALRVLAQDVRTGLHISDDPPSRCIYAHVEGGLYELLGTCEVKNDLTGDWDEGVCYRSLTLRKDVLYVTSLQRFDDRFVSVEDPDAVVS